MQDAHPKTLSCCVVAKAQRGTGTDVKWCKRNARIEAAGEQGAPLHLKIKAYHMDVEGDAELAGFPMEEIDDLLMPRRWYLNAIDRRVPDRRTTLSRRSPRGQQSTMLS
jgi:hypothetical protein